MLTVIVILGGSDMKRIKTEILGTTYEVSLGDKEEIGLDKDHLGECRIFGKKILVKTNQDDCVEDELRVRTQEAVAHEIFHAFINESGIDLEPSVEEQIACFYMKNWRKMNNAVLEVLDETGFLDK